jgi:Thioredoxin
LKTEIKNKIQNISLTYNQYIDLTKKEIEKTEVNSLNDAEKTLFEYKKLNLQRSSRIEKYYSVSDELKSIIQSFKQIQTWVIITENWCGDSAQTLPYIAAFTKINPLITFKIILRDSNLDIMDQYLTNGTRSIPKLIVFDENWNEFFGWGPRPEAAKELMEQLNEEGLSKTEKYEKLHLWYGRNRGKDIEQEFRDLLLKLSAIQEEMFN